MSFLDHSAEKQAKRALLRAVFWRIVGDCVALPRVLLNAVVMICNGLSGWFRSVEMAVFYLELDAARKYKLLTGLDIAAATGDLTRYGLIEASRVDLMQGQMLVDRTGIEELGGDDES